MDSGHILWPILVRHRRHVRVKSIPKLSTLHRLEFWQGKSKSLTSMTVSQLRTVLRTKGDNQVCKANSHHSRAHIYTSPLILQYTNALQISKFIRLCHCTPRTEKNRVSQNGNFFTTLPLFFFTLTLTFFTPLPFFFTPLPLFSLHPCPYFFTPLPLLVLHPYPYFCYTLTLTFLHPARCCLE